MLKALYYISDFDQYIFPHPEVLPTTDYVAIGGDISVDRLLLAYQYGFFPWFNESEPVIWWHPIDRFVIFPQDIYVAKSMRPYFNQQKYRLTFDTAFEEVINHCKNIKRRDADSTWISDDFVTSYTRLHHMGLAHSVEVWDKDGHIIGGLYGVSTGKIFFGESMFSYVSNASKFALISLAKLLKHHGYWMIDCQMPTSHLKSMGGKFVKRKDFVNTLRKNYFEKTKRGNWEEIIHTIPTSKILEI